MARDFCPNETPECRYYKTPSGCFSDIDHIVPQRHKSLHWIIAKYIYTPDNQVQTCRVEHDAKTANRDVTESIELIPPFDVMARAILADHERGETVLRDDQVIHLRGLVENGE